MRGRKKSAPKAAKKRKALARRPATRPSRKAPSTEGLATRAQAAAELGVEPNRINKWVADGAPVAIRGSRGHSAFYDLEALRAWRDSKKPPEQYSGLSLGAARARLAEAQAQKWERENLVRAGQLLEREAVDRDGQAVIRALQARLLALPRQAVMRGVIPREHEPALRALIVETLRELARWRTVEDAEAEGPLLEGAPAS